MAGDWLKVEKDTPEKPEVLALATLLSISVAEAFLACFKLWRWADAQTVDGNAARVTPALLDSLCGLPGFSDALREVGWLQVRESSLVLPNFSRHMGQPAKARALAATRIKRHRDDTRNAPSVTKPLPEKRREEKSKEEPPLPPVLDTPEFAAVWAEWVQYRKERRQALTPSCIRKQLKMLAGLGLAGAIESINRSIEKGWQGLVDPAEFARSSRNGAASSAAQQTAQNLLGFGEEEPHEP